MSGFAGSIIAPRDAGSRPEGAILVPVGGYQPKAGPCSQVNDAQARANAGIAIAGGRLAGTN